MYDTKIPDIIHVFFIYMKTVLVFNFTDEFYALYFSVQCSGGPQMTSNVYFETPITAH